MLCALHHLLGGSITVPISGQFGDRKLNCEWTSLAETPDVAVKQTVEQIRSYESHLIFVHSTCSNSFFLAENI